MALALLALAVAALHSCLGQAIGERMDEMQLDASLPPRLSVTYVRDLSPSAPMTPKHKAPTRHSSTQLATAAVTPAGPLAGGENGATDKLQTTAEPAPQKPQQEAIPTPHESTTEQPTGAAPPPPRENTEPPEEAIASRFKWPRSTRLSYSLSGQFRGEVHGTAQVEWIKRGDAYQVFMDVQSGPLFERHMRSEGHVTPQGLVPHRYQQKSKALFQEPRMASITFDAEGVVLANGQRAKTMPGVQDTASQFVQLTYLFRNNPEKLAAGHQIELPIALPRQVKMWVYDVLKPEVLSTPIGPLQTYQLRPRRPNESTGNDLKAEVWFAPELQYLPVRIRIVQDENTYIDLLISRKPEVEGED